MSTNERRKGLCVPAPARSESRHFGAARLCRFARGSADVRCAHSTTRTTFRPPPRSSGSSAWPARCACKPRGESEPLFSQWRRLPSRCVPPAGPPLSAGPSYGVGVSATWRRAMNTPSRRLFALEAAHELAGTSGSGQGPGGERARPVQGRGLAGKIARATSRDALGPRLGVDAHVNLNHQTRSPRAVRARPLRGQAPPAPPAGPGPGPGRAERLRTSRRLKPGAH